MVMKIKSAELAWIYCYNHNIDPKTVKVKGKWYVVEDKTQKHEHNMPRRSMRPIEKAMLCIERGTN